MVYFPVRKCYYIAKVSLLLVLVVSVLGLFEKWRGGKRAASAMDPFEQEYEKEILEDEARIIPGLGEGGVAAYLTGKDLKLGEQSEKKLAMNVYLSDRIAYNRTLKDQRNPACARVTYDAELPSASVILIFHNEPYSVVIRTIWSVINSCRRDNPWFQKANYIGHDGRTMKLGYPGQEESSPLVYLKEIILVDDNSTLPELKGKLSHYVRTRLPPDLIRILRLPDRVGLTRARLAGARYATGSVLVFLDSHCEAQTDWLRPQLQAIKDHPHAVVMPIIDTIDQSNFFYSTQENSEFQGLMKARIRGARSSRGDVLIFLDAHCEAENDWMRPMLQRVRDKRDAVVTPIIDVLDQSTFSLDAADIFQVGGFTFTGHFTWIDVSPEEKKRRGSEISPTWSPTMAGGLFAINREYYWELGAYDEQMAGWGGENLEMSFRIWQCGGTLETIPCSRVGHVFRSFHPYSMPADSDTHGVNTARMAEVWMDEYAELFYLHRPDLRNNPKIGDVTHRKVLREKLRCKNFQWFLDNIYKDKFVPVRDAYGYGRIRNPASNLCIDTLQREGAEHPLGVYQCHPTLQATQYLSLSLSHQLRDEETCAQIQFNRHDSSEDYVGRKVVMSNCHGRREQKWQLLKPTKQLQHMESRLCLDAGRESGADLVARPCSDSNTQRWEIDYTEDNDFKKPNEVESNELEQKLSRLRGPRRKSRSLLSYKPDERRHRKKKHQKPKKRSKKIKTKNKFILKVVRTLMNDTEEHLEMDVHCKHRQLFPNNSFVRDLVTILNERNIKVINNGRVFERNKVTQLDPKKDEDRKVLNILDIAQQKPPKETFPRKRKPKVLAPENAEQNAMEQPGAEHVAINQSELQHVGASGLDAAGDGNASETSLSPRSHRIIIEDFIEMSPTKNSKAHKHKKKIRKRINPPLISPPPAGKGGGDGMAGSRFAAKSVEEQIGGPINVEFIDDAPMFSESETNRHPSERDNTHDDKQRKRKKHKKLTKKTSDERNEQERDSLQPLDKDSDIEVWNVGESRFRTDDISRRRDTPETARYIGHTTREPETDNSPENQHSYTKRKHKPATDQTEKDRTQKLEGTDQMGRGSKKPEVLNQHDWFETPTSEVVDQVRLLKKPKSDLTGKYSNHGVNDVDSFRKAGLPEVNDRKHEPEVMTQTIRHHAVDSESDRQTDNDLDKTREEWSDEATTRPSPVKVVMKSNLTFNLGDEFFKWRVNNRQSDADSKQTIDTRGAPPAPAWQLSDDVTHPSDNVTHPSDNVTHQSKHTDEVTEPDRNDSEEKSNSSSESASSE